MKRELIVPTPETMKELRRILRMEARFEVLLQEELAAKKLALERTERLANAARGLADARRSEAWKHWKSHIIDDGKEETMKTLRQKILLSGSNFR